MVWGFWQVIVTLIVIAIIVYWIKQGGKKKAIEDARKVGEVSRELKKELSDATDTIKNMTNAFTGKDKKEKEL